MRSRSPRRPCCSSPWRSWRRGSGRAGRRRSIRWLLFVMNDVRYAFRALRTSPGFALTAILTLALGIGLATAVFTVADALLLRRLPVRDQDRLVVLWGQAPDRGFDYPFQLDEARQFARRTRSLTQVAFFGYEGAWPRPIRDGERISRLRGALVSGEFFDVLGAQPVLGRALHAADDVVGAAPVVVLSHGIWQRQFGGDAKVLGRQIVTYGTGVAYTIVGVMPQGLDYPRGADIWAPLVPARTRPGTDSTVADVEVIGRLRPRARAGDRRAVGAGRGPTTGRPPTARRECAPRARRRRPRRRGGGGCGPELRRRGAGRAAPPGRDSAKYHRARRRGRHHGRRHAPLRPRARGHNLARRDRAGTPVGNAAERQPALPPRDGRLGGGTGRSRATRPLRRGTCRPQPHQPRTGRALVRAFTPV